MYFLRLAKLKPAVEQVATEAWKSIKVGMHFLSEAMYLIIDMNTTRLLVNMRDGWNEYSTCDRASFAGSPEQFTWICH